MPSLDAQSRDDRSASGRLRVLHGLSPAAGQPWTLTRALRKLGVEADCFSLGTSIYDYGADRIARPTQDEQRLGELLCELAPEYDVFHFHYRPFLPLTRAFGFPAGLDLLTLRAAGKTLIVSFQGSEVRLHSAFERMSPYAYAKENAGGLRRRFPEETQRRYVQYVDAVVDRVLVPDHELLTYVPQAMVVPRAVDLAAWPFVGAQGRDAPLVVHAPSRRDVKGTKHVLAAVRRLRRDGVRFEFQLVENMENAAAREVYRRADIIVDQLRIGWYGVLAVEGMALGKAVISYVRDDLRSHLGSDLPPLAVASPPTFEAVLRDLLRDPRKRRQLGRRARDYCERTHDSRRIAAALRDIYTQARATPKPVDVARVWSLVAYQQDRIERSWLGRARRLAGYPRRLAATVKRIGRKYTR